MSLSTKKLAERFDKKKREHETVDLGGVDLFSRDSTYRAIFHLLFINILLGVRGVVNHKLRHRRGAFQRIVPGAVAVNTAKAEQEGKEQEAERLEKKKNSDKATAKVDELMANAEGSKSHVSLQGSHKSGKSGHSSKKEGGSKIVEALLSAAPDAIRIDAPAKALADHDSDVDDDLEDNAFNHPSTWEPQRWIWLPRWKAFPAVSEELMKELKESKVDASDLGAVIDDGGNVEVTRGPPDEDWSGGLDK
jgi:hypothetical protein